jgi:hypothetical protein
MIYLKIIQANMKKKTQTIRVSLWITLGITILLTNLALDRTGLLAQEATTMAATPMGTAADGAGAQSGAGSTDGIMLVAVMIVLIVITPILLKRRAWENGKRNKTAPPS